MRAPRGRGEGGAPRGGGAAHPAPPAGPAAVLEERLDAVGQETLRPVAAERGDELRPALDAHRTVQRAARRDADEAGDVRAARADEPRRVEPLESNPGCA